MNIGKACAIFEQINSDKYTDNEKLIAIHEFFQMPTYNGITKNKIINAFRWFFEFANEVECKEFECIHQQYGICNFTDKECDYESCDFYGECTSCVDQLICRED